MRLTPLRAAMIALLTILTLVATTTSADAATVRHHGKYWVWFGPSSWHASYGAYGITVASRSGQDVLDLGFSSTVCTGGATYSRSVTNHFAAIRTQYNRGAYRIVKAGKITHPRGTSKNYRREALRMSIRSGGITYSGAFYFDYDYQTTVSTGYSTVNYCYQRSLALYAPSSRFDTSSRAQLTKVFHSLAYSGPGACRGKTAETCDADL